MSFATTCWEKDWRLILLDPDYLRVRQIAHHQFPFVERLLIINNVDDLALVKAAAQTLIDEGVLTRYVVADGTVLSYFGLRREDFKPDEGIKADWVYYNALGPLTAIYEAKGDYLLYLTGDVRLDAPCDWIAKALKFMEKRPEVRVAGLTWNGKYNEAKKESYRKTWNFYVAKEGFSDQLFLVRQKDFRAPIYGEIRDDSHHFPRGDVFEKRCFSYMKNRGWERIIYRRGSYIHENV